MSRPREAGIDPLPFVLAALLVAATIAGGAAALALGFSDAAAGLRLPG